MATLPHDMQQPTRSEQDTAQSARWARLVLGVLLLVSVAGNLWWIAHNQILIGRDASGYLQTALEYRDFLSPLSWQGIFEAFVHPPYRTPGLYIAAQPWLLLSMAGGAMDSAQLVNVFFHALTVLLTWWLARTFAGVWTSLLAAALVAFLPHMAAMARLFYTEAFLVAMVALNLLALYRSEGFTRRGWSLVWGASAGAGLLVKWTFPIYMALPLLAVLWRERKGLWRVPEWSLRVLFFAILAGVAFVAIWWLPNRTIASALYAGNWSAAGWFLIVSAFVYALLTSPRHGRWLAAAALLGVWIASLWYLPHGDFAQSLLATDMERGSNPLGPLDWKSYAEYAEYLVQQQLGALLFWVMIPAAMAPWLWRLVRERRSLCPPANLLWWSLLSALLVLTQISQRNARNLAPLLPQMAILVALGISAWQRIPRTVIAVASLCVLLLQWSIITFDTAQPLRAASSALWVYDEYAASPASGKTAGGYSVAADLLRAVADAQQGDVSESLGVLVNADFLHRGMLRYWAKSLALPVEITDLTEEDATWQDVVDSQWLLIKDGDNNNAELAALALIDRIAQGDPLFEALYAREEAWHLPNGDMLSLYRRDGPGFPDADAAREEAASRLATELFTYALPETTVVYGNPELAVWLGRFGPTGEVRVMPAGWDGSEAALLAGLQGTVAAVLDSNTLALEAWLDQAGVRVASFTDGDLALVFYAMTPDAVLESIPIAYQWDAPIPELLGIEALTNATGGSVVPMRTTWSADGQGVKWSVRLVDGAGNVVAANDRPLLAQDRFGLLLPALLPPGRYEVVARLYNEATLEPIPNHAGIIDAPLFAVTVD